MPATSVLFYCDASGTSTVADWLAALREQDPKSYANCVARITQLGTDGFEMRRPAADYLRDGIYELRAKRGHVQYRMLYFFHGRNVAVLVNAIIKKGSRVSPVEIERALSRKLSFESNPNAHTYAVEE